MEYFFAKNTTARDWKAILDTTDVGLAEMMGPLSEALWGTYCS